MRTSQRNIRLLLIGLLLCMVVFPLRAEEKKPFEIPDYDRGIYFFGNSLTDYSNLTYSYSQKLWRGISLRANIQLNRTGEERDETTWNYTGIPDSTYTAVRKIDSDNTSTEISLLATWTQYKRDRLEMTSGIGPYFSYSSSLMEQNQTSYNALTLKARTESSGWRIGAEGFSGVRWWVSSRIAILAEYYARVYYEKTKTTLEEADASTNHEYRKVNERETKRSRLYLNTVRVGVSYYF